MKQKNPLNLKEAKAKRKVDQFIKEQAKRVPKANRQSFEGTLHAMIKNQPATPATSSEDTSES